MQVHELVGVIDRIIAQTTTGGRPGASRADPLGVFEAGSSEAGTRAEVYTGERTGDRWHGDKCADDARGLTAAINNLTTLRGLPDGPPARKEIDDGLAKARERLPGLEAGAAAWAGRGKLASGNMAAGWHSQTE